MTEEVFALHKTNTWELVSLPFEKHAIGSRSVYKIKIKYDRLVDVTKHVLLLRDYLKNMVWIMKNLCSSVQDDYYSHSY